MLRSNISTFKDEHLSDLANRFEFIFINALISFIKEGMVVNTNVATGARSSSVRKKQKFMQYDRTLSRNISGLNLFDNTSQRTIYSKLIKAIMNHPIFQLTSETPSYPIIKYDIESKKTSKNDHMNDIDLFNLNEDEIVSYYYKLSGYNFVTIGSAYSWAEDNRENAIKIYDRIIKDNEIYNQTGGNDYFSRLFKGIARALDLDE